MLGDDIMEGTKSVVGAVKHAAGSSVKGALMWGAIAAVVVVGAAIVMGATAGLAAPELGLIPGVLGQLGSLVTEGLGSTIDIVGGTALIGGAVTGIANLIPGKDEGWGMKDIFKRRERTREQERSHEMAQGHHGQRSRREPHNAYPAQQPAASSPTAYIVHTPSTIVDNSQRTQVYHSEAPNVAYKSGNTRNEEKNTLNYSPETSTATSVQVPVEVKAAQPQATTGAPLLTANDTAPTTVENPFYRQGKGMELMQKGDARSEAALSK